jgi:hypothetical protein
MNKGVCEEWCEFIGLGDWHSLSLSFGLFCGGGQLL